MQLNGSALVTINNKTIFEKYFCFADLQRKIPTYSRTQYLIASVTKQFTAVALLNALYERAKKSGRTDKDWQTNINVALQKYVSTYLPKDHEIWADDMPAWADTVTLDQLLVHSSGIPNYTSLPYFENQKSLQARDLVTFFKNFPLEFSPGKKFSYRNSNYFL